MKKPILFLTILLACQLSLSQHETPSQQAPLPAPSNLPTAEQLAKGQKLLNHILHVMRTIPITEPMDVFDAFGVRYVNATKQTWQGHDYDRYSANVYSHVFAKEALERWGLSSMSIQNKLRKPNFADASFPLQWPLKACITVEQVRAAMQNTGALETHVRVVTAPPQSKGDTEIGALAFQPITFPKNHHGVISFRFSYSHCVGTIGITYKLSN